MAQVARMFGVSEQTANKWRKRKHKPLVAARVGKAFYTTRENIQAFTDQPMVNGSGTQQIDEETRRELALHGLKI